MDKVHSIIFSHSYSVYIHLAYWEDHWCFLSKHMCLYLWNLYTQLSITNSYHIAIAMNLVPLILLSLTLVAVLTFYLLLPEPQNFSYVMLTFRPLNFSHIYVYAIFSYLRSNILFMLHVWCCTVGCCTCYYFTLECIYINSNSHVMYLYISNLFL